MSVVQARTKTDWAPCGRREVHQDYYTPRPAIADYSDYWGTVSDPDGVVRKRNTSDERMRFQDDILEDATWLNSLECDSVLDFGAGLGWFLGMCSAPIKGAVEIAPQAIKALESKGVRVYGQLSEVSTSSYSCVIAHHVLEHVTDPIGALVHIHRILYSGGHLLVGTPDFGSPCAKRFGQNYRLLHDKTHCSLFTLEGMTRMLRDNGFEILETTFPFPERYATPENWARWNDTSKVSPPWPGNFITLKCQRA